MDGVLSQEEINALLNEPGAEASDSAENELSDAQKDAIGEIANISMGTAATTLFSLVNHKVEISTPVVSQGLITAKEGITLEDAKKILAKSRKEKLPIVDDDFNLKGLITIKDIEKQIKYPLAAKDEQGRLLCGAAVGITANVLARVDALVKASVDVIVIDSAHGHSENILKAVREIKAAYPELQVIAGNVATVRQS